MTKFALFVRLEAKPGQEAAVASFLPARCRWPMPKSWHCRLVRAAVRPWTFGVLDAFADEEGCRSPARPNRRRVDAANAATLLSIPPNIERIDLPKAKLPG